MRQTIIVVFVVISLVLSLFTFVVTSYAQQGDLDMWVSNWRVQIFKDTAQPGSAATSIHLVTARNEYEPAQIVLRSKLAFTIQRVVSSNLISEGNTLSNSHFKYNFVDYVHADKNSGGPGYCGDAMADPIRRAPADFPEQLSNDTIRLVGANITQPIWVKYYIPTNAAVGMYSGTVIITTSLGTIQVPVSVQVTQATLPDPKGGTFSSEFWIYPHTITRVFGYPALSPNWWKIVDDFAALMREARMNVQLAWTKYLLGLGGSKWDVYDRYVQRFIDTGGVKKITTETMGGRAIQYAHILETHLRQKGWLHMFYMKIIDEPSHVEAYVSMSNAVKQLSPSMKVGDPGITNPQGYGTTVDIWQPHITYDGGYDAHAREFEAIKKRPSTEVWVYTTCMPTHGQLNRLIDNRVFLMELFGWYTFSRDLKGFLHWGLANWENYPNERYFQTVGSLGDAWSVYPDVAHGSITSSIRVESAREAAEDHELFRLLEKTNPTLAHQIVDSIIRSPDDFERNTDTIQSKRDQLVWAIAANSKGGRRHR